MSLCCVIWQSWYSDDYPLGAIFRQERGTHIPTLTARARLLYSSGVVNYALKDAAFGAFILFYYKQVLGLSGTLTGIAIAISIIWDAVSDPLVGAWSDNLRTRWGRRHPLMLPRYRRSAGFQRPSPAHLGVDTTHKTYEHFKQKQQQNNKS